MKLFITSTFSRTAMILLMMLSAESTFALQTDYDLQLTSEYNVIPTIYAGCQNYFTLKVENTGTAAGSNIAAKLYLGDELIETKNIASLPSGETTTLEFCDPTIRPINENTINGNSNENAVYKVVIKDDGGEKTPKDFSFVILYNGNLGKDYAYPNSNPTKREFSFTGEVKILVGDGYSAGNETSRDDVFTVNLGEGESVNKALLYVSYNWDKVETGDFNSWTTTFNGNSIAPLASYRDQSNLGSYGRYGYGLVVYDVTASVVSGDNTFAFQKTSGNVSVYPSSLIVMVNKPSATPKTVYIVEETDLLSKSYNKNMDAIYTSSFEGITGDNAKLYVFAATAQAGEGDVIINDVPNVDVWAGTSQSVDVFQTAVDPGDITVKFKATGSTILALHQMIVVDNNTTITIEEDIEGGETVKTDIKVDKDDTNKEVTITSAKPTTSGGTTVAIPTTVTIGSTIYTVTSIGDNALAGQTSVTDIYLPEMDKPLKIGKDALKIDDTHVATVHVPLSLLDDYGTDAELKQNVEASKLEAEVTPQNQYWSFSCGVDVDIPVGVAVYKCKINDEGKAVVITQIKDSELNGIIKANNGVLLSSNAGNTYKLVVNKNNSIVTVATGDNKSYGNDNQLEPVIETKHYDAGDYYVLYNNEFHAILDNSSKVPACLAVLHKPANVFATRGLGFEGDLVTAISSISVDNNNSEWYNLNGQRISKPTNKGVYIKDGKKYMVK